MGDVHIQQGPGFFDLVVQVSPGTEGGDQITVTSVPHAETEREAGG